MSGWQSARRKEKDTMSKTEISDISERKKKRDDRLRERQKGRDIK